MRKTRLVEFLIRIIPIKLLQDFLIRHFLLTNESYHQKLADLNEVRSILVDEREVSGIPSLWPRIRHDLPTLRAPAAHGMRSGLRWAFQVLGLCMVLVLGFWLIRHRRPDNAPSAAGSPGSFRIQSIRLENKPATTFLYQPKDSKFIMVWAEKIS